LKRKSWQFLSLATVYIGNPYSDPLIYYTPCQHGSVVQRPQTAESKRQKNWQQNEYIKWEILILCTKKIFKLLSQINRKSINNSSFLKSVISVIGSHCYCSHQVLKNLATPFLVWHFNSQFHCIFMPQNLSWQSFRQLNIWLIFTTSSLWPDS
jgi:hypothetical protein